ncbi:hypothetical protein SAMN00017405_0377 [Desulfonispora thiosulfatigenes DSM 11270]|uniref:Uncharacterized protein n=1 Tax=Desulfonispora thiosulfatigenes DSM 11270 TaxID=656914 RepID=A0A1W1VPQ8_DESTI|nr:hypothetical protein [Desulfonispora thiosulfatigenes]SMB95316.1 hypothetical protein SAMN00017405_0377 [Desulfonispora thiosulfatigenes DSM 11270]
MNLIEKLPDNYNKNPNSINAKLFELTESEFKELEYTFKMIELYRDMDRAKGFTLDKIGRNVLEYRNDNDDLNYRKAIKVKIKANQSPGDIETINEVASFLLGDSYEGLSETWIDSKYGNEPAGLCLIVNNINTQPVIIGEIIRLNGSYFLNGETFLNAGLEINNDKLLAFESAKNNIKRVAAGAIKLYWELPEKIVCNFGINIRNSVKINIFHKSSSLVTINQKIILDIINVDVLRSKAYLDGTYFLNGQTNLDSLRDRVINKVNVLEVRK